MNLEELMSCVLQAKKDDKAYADSAPNCGLFMGEWVRDVDAAKKSWDRISEQLSSNNLGEKDAKDS